MYVSELDGYPRSESICVCAPDAWSFASAENVQYSNVVVWRREKIVRRPPRARYKMYRIGFDLMLRGYIYRSECFCTQNAYVGVCAQVESVHRSSGPPKYSTKGKFLINYNFFREASLSTTMTPVRPYNCMSLPRLGDFCSHLVLRKCLVIDYVSDFTGRVCWLI